MAGVLYIWTQLYLVHMLQNRAYGVHDALLQARILDAQHLFRLLVVKLVHVGGEVVLRLVQRRKAVPEMRAGAQDDVGDALVRKVPSPTKARGSASASSRVLGETRVSVGDSNAGEGGRSRLPRPPCVGQRRAVGTHTR